MSLINKAYKHLRFPYRLSYGSGWAEVASSVHRAIYLGPISLVDILAIMLSPPMSNVFRGVSQNKNTELLLDEMEQLAIKNGEFSNVATPPPNKFLTLIKSQSVDKEYEFILCENVGVDRYQTFPVDNLHISHIIKLPVVMPDSWQGKITGLEFFTAIVDALNNRYIRGI